MILLADPETREPLAAFVPGDRSLRPLMPDLDYERSARMTELDTPTDAPDPSEDETEIEPSNDPVPEPVPDAEPDAGNPPTDAVTEG